MREILFRAKAINCDPNREYRTNYQNGDWVYGLVESLPLLDRKGKLKYRNDWAEMCDVNGANGIDVDYETIGQFTGLTDKNGKPIFDRDIVGCFGNTQIFEIKWCSVRGGYFLDNIRMSGLGECRPECLGNLTDTLEVIGNVFDNPELLEWVE